MTDDFTPARGRRGPLIGLFAAALLVVGAAVFAIVQPWGGAGTPEDAPSTNSTPTSSPTVQPSTPGTPSATPSGDADGTALSTTNGVLDESAGGQDAIDALGDRLDDVAERNGMTPDELTRLLLEDDTARVSVNGLVYFEDSRTR